jgi:hypothetical protein
MIRDTIDQIEAQIQHSRSLSDDQKAELHQLLARLKTEISALPAAHQEQAKSIAGFTQVSTHEATREQRNPHLFKLSLEGLSSSVEGFETSHPRLVQIVNAISTTLSNMGI